MGSTTKQNAHLPRPVKQIALLLALFFAANVASAESAYNKGVAAWGANDFAQARAHWKQSLSEGGPDSAYNNLGFLFYHGLGGNQDRALAVTLWLKGAALSVSEAQFHLGEAYAQGHGGLRRSRVQAFAWLECARVTASRLSASDSTEGKIEKSAVEALAKLAPALSAKDRAAADVLAQEFIGKYASALPVVRTK